MAASKLQWDRNAEADMDHYNIYLNGLKQAVVPQVAVGVIPEWPLGTNTAGTLTVTAVDKSGNESAMSVSVPFDLVAPTAPANPRLI